MGIDREDPAADPRARYDYRGPAFDAGAPDAAGDGFDDDAGAGTGPPVEPEFIDELDDRLEGAVRFDEYTRQSYATDASIYEMTPIGVAFPVDTADVATAVAFCVEEGVAVLPRGAGTSLGGQAVNEAVVLDLSRHMDVVLSVDADERTVTAQPGVRLGDLNAAIRDTGLKFAPDPAWGDKSALGGAIGNNSTGAHSLVYGKTDAYVEELEVVLADGTVTRFGAEAVGDLPRLADGRDGIEGAVYAELARIIDEEAAAIEDAYPDLHRNVSGYNLDMLVEEAASGTVNVGRVLAGSEGTLAVVTRATMGLEPIPETKSMALLTYDDLVDAMADVPHILDHDPAAVEVMDEILLELARETEEFAEVADLVPHEAGAILLVEFYADDDAHGREQVDALLDDRTGREPPADRPDTIATEAIEAHDDEARARFWKLRKAGLPILLSRTDDRKHIAFIEDCAVPPTQLADYVADVQDVLDEHDAHAAVYAHAGPGCLHIRPLIDVKTVDGVETMAAIADAVTDLVVEYDGSVSGEHGDGRARTQWNEKRYGADVLATFRSLKDAFDPQGLLNPGNVCGDASMTEHLRFGPEYEFDSAIDPALEWPIDGGFQGMVELCHGCGGCRGSQETTGGVMCPTYRAAEEELLSTRARANLLRQALSGDLPAGTLESDAFREEVLDLCIGCKGCARDCPSQVDMAKLKAEVVHAHHQADGATVRERLFASLPSLAPWASRLDPLPAWLSGLPGADVLLEKTLGIARERDLPRFRRNSLQRWAAANDLTGRAVTDVADNEVPKVAVFPDPYTNYVHPDAGRAAVRVLQAAGAEVIVPNWPGDSGRAALSTGFIERARDAAGETVDRLAPLVDDGWDVVCVEPSSAAMLQSDLLDLQWDADARAVADSTYGVMEYLDGHDLIDGLDVQPPETPAVYHGHCHQRAVGRDHHAVATLRRAGFEVTALDSGCCGMAGSFGYEAEHYSMSRAIGELLFDLVADHPEGMVTAPGSSCRAQLESRNAAADVPPHPVELLDDARLES